MKKTSLIKNLQRFSITASVTTAASLSIYAGILTNILSTIQISHQKTSFFQVVKILGYWNYLLLFGLLLFAAKSVANIYSSRIKKLEIRSEHISSIEKILYPAVGLLSFKAGDRVDIRALVTIYIPSTDRRVTICGININADPEKDSGVPADFGVSGEAFINGKVAWQELSINHHKSYPVDLQGRIWKDIRSIVVFPLRDSKGKVIGTLNFDSSSPMKVTKFNDRKLHHFLCHFAEIVAIYLEGIVNNEH